MKRFYLFFAIVCIGLYACDNNHETISGLEDEMVVIENKINEQYGRYDDDTFLSEILQNGLKITNKYIYSDQWIESTGGVLTISSGNISFFEDGTCRTYFMVKNEYKYTNTLLYREYKWSYDADSNTIVTTSLENGKENCATIKYFGEGTVIVDGNICVDHALVESRKIYELTSGERDAWAAEAIPYILAKRGVVRDNDEGFKDIIAKIESYEGDPDELIFEAIKNRAFVSTNNDASDTRRLYFYYDEYGYQYHTYPLVEGWQYPDAYLFMENGECRVCYNNCLADPTVETPYYTVDKWSYDSEKNMIVREDSFGNKGYGEVVYIDDKSVILKGNFSLYKDEDMSHELNIINIGDNNRESYLSRYSVLK